MKIDQYTAHIVETIRGLPSFSKILITGWVWTGKTTLVKGLFPNAYFMAESEFKQNIVAQRAWLMPAEMNRSEHNIRNHPIEALSRFEYVIYDDYGVADLSPAYIEKTLYWLDHRQKPFWDRPKKTIFTTNLTIDELKTREERIASRILEKCHVFVLDGPDRRHDTTIYHHSGGTE